MVIEISGVKVAYSTIGALRKFDGEVIRVKKEIFFL